MNGSHCQKVALSSYLHEFFSEWTCVLFKAILSIKRWRIGLSLTQAIVCNHNLLFFSRVVCKCGYCGAQKQALSEWERHTGSKIKNWKTSVRVKGSLLPLEQWVCILKLLMLLMFWNELLIFIGNYHTIDNTIYSFAN